MSRPEQRVEVATVVASADTIVARTAPGWWTGHGSPPTTLGALARVLADRLCSRPQGEWRRYAHEAGNYEKSTPADRRVWASILRLAVLRQREADPAAHPDFLRRFQTMARAIIQDPTVVVSVLLYSSDLGRPA